MVIGAKTKVMKFCLNQADLIAIPEPAQKTKTNSNTKKIESFINDFNKQMLCKESQFDKSTNPTVIQ